MFLKIILGYNHKETNFLISAMYIVLRGNTIQFHESLIHLNGNFEKLSSHITGKILSLHYSALLMLYRELKAVYCIFTTCFNAGILACLFFDPEDGDDMFLPNLGSLSTDYTASYPRR
jgi:hypothetical protein